MSTKEERDRAYITGWLADHDCACSEAQAEAFRQLLNMHEKEAAQAAFTQVITACAGGIAKLRDA